MATKKTTARGTEVVLADGNTWTIPPMPFGRRARPILDLMDQAGELEDDPGAKYSDIVDLQFKIGCEVLKLNYEFEDESEMDDLFDASNYAAVMQAVAAQAIPQNG